MTWPYLPGPLSHCIPTIQEYRLLPVFRQIISQRLAGQLAATGREILQVIIPGGERSLTGSQLQSMSEGLQAGPGVRIHFFTFPS